MLLLNVHPIKVSKILNFNALKTLYMSLIMPYLSYCCVIWGNASKCIIQKVIVLQKRVIRVVCNSKYSDHTLPLFRKCKLLKFEDLVNTNILIIMFKVYHNLLPDNIQKFFIKNINCPYRTRLYGKFNTMYLRTNLKSSSISFTGVKLWNSLSCDMVNLTCLNKFKQNLKNNIIESYC